MRWRRSARFEAIAALRAEPNRAGKG
jgi:hypothetical protein